jgi:quaternary ammonium compound-resistance protein SugE
MTAGGAEIAWSQSIRPTDGFTRPTDGFTRPLPTILCLVLAIAAIYPLTRAMRDLPVGTAYAAFTGIGSVGAVVLGIVISGDSIGPARLAGVALILGGVIFLRATGSG